MMCVKQQIFAGLLVIYATFLILVSAAPPSADQLNRKYGNPEKDDSNYPLNLKYLGAVGRKGFFLEANLTMNWTSADSFCKESGLALATMETKEEWDLLTKALVPYGLEFKCWTSGRESRLPSMFVWDGTTNHPNQSVFTHWQWRTPELSQCLATVVWGSTTIGDHLDIEANYCNENHNVLCQLIQ